MATLIVSDHEVPNPKIKGEGIVPAEFLERVRGGRTDDDFFFVDVNAFDNDELAEVIRSKANVVSYFYDCLPTEDLSPLGINAVYWSKAALSNAPKIDAIVNQLERGEVLPLRDLPQRLKNKPGSNVINFLLSSKVIGILAVVGVLCALCSVLAPQSMLWLTQNEESALIGSLTIASGIHTAAMYGVILFAVLVILLRTARGVYEAVKVVTAKGLAPLDKAGKILVEVVTIELLVLVISILLCLYLGIFTPTPSTMLNPTIVTNPVVDLFASIGTYSQYLFVLMPQRVIVGFVLPVIAIGGAIIVIIALFVAVLGAPVATVELVTRDVFGNIIEIIPIDIIKR